MENDSAGLSPVREDGLYHFFVKKNMGFNFIRQIIWALTRLGLFTKPQFCFAERDRGGERERETVANGGKNGLLLLDF